MQTALLTLLAALSLFLSPGLATAQSTDLPPELDRVLRDYEAGWAARDAGALAALFTEDGWALSPGAPPVFGRAAIEASYKGRGGPLDLRVLDFRMAEGLAIIVGEYAGAPGEAPSGKYVLTLSYDEAAEVWFILSDMDNANP